MPKTLCQTYRITAAGCIAVPAEARRMLGIRIGDRMEVSIDGDKLIMRKADTHVVVAREKR